MTIPPASVEHIGDCAHVYLCLLAVVAALTFWAAPAQASGCGVGCWLPGAMPIDGIVGAGLPHSESSYNPGQYNEPPVIRRFLISVIGYVGGFLIALRGSAYFDNQRRGIGSALILAGFLVSLSGFLFWLSTYGWALWL